MLDFTEYCIKIVRVKQMKKDIILNVKVITSARKNEIVGKRDESIVIKLDAHPEKGKANKRLIAFLSELLKVRKSNITILKGATSHIKRLEIIGVDEERLFKLL